LTNCRIAELSIHSRKSTKSGRTQFANSSIRKFGNVLAVFAAFSTSATAPGHAHSDLSGRSRPRKDAFAPYFADGGQPRCTIFWHRVVDGLHSIENAADKNRL
jgi:hypothetical protein